MTEGQGGYDPFKEGMETYEKDKAVKEAAAKAAGEKPPEPSADAVALAEERKRREKAEEDLRKTNESHDRRLDQFNEFLQGRMDDKVTRQDSPAPDVSDADFDKSPSEAWDKKFDTRMKVVLEEVGGHYGKIIGDLTDQVFDAQVESLSKERFFPYLKGEIQGFFDKNPEAKRSKKAAKTVYDQYVGNRIEELIAQEAKDKQDQLDLATDTTPTRRSVASPADGGGGRTPPARMPMTPEKDKVHMGESERALFDIYQRFGAFDDEEDWQNWKDTIQGGDRHDIPTDLQERGR